MATKSILERLEFWGLELEKIDGEWILSGLDEQEDLALEPDITRPQALMWLSTNLDDFVLSKETLEKRLDWRGYYSRESGWALNVKLDKVWNYMRQWDHVTDNFEEREPPDWIERNHVETDWEWFKETLPSTLDHKRFMLGGRSGGWLLYTEELLRVDEAEALLDVYSKVPILLDDLCQSIATETVAWMCAEEWGMEYEAESATAFNLYNGDKTLIRLEITYGS